jgi:phospholipase/lecithinase/hemolysin
VTGQSKQIPYHPPVKSTILSITAIVAFFALQFSCTEYRANMNRILQVAFGIWLLASAVIPAKAAFSSLYVFGDALSSTTGNPDKSDYYAGRYSNGRVWVEVLAQRQGLIFDNTKNSSYWDHNSSLLAGELNNFNPPADVANDLFIVWVCNADTFDATSAVINNQTKNPTVLLSQFVSANVLAQASELQIILNLYAKGVRTLIMPNAVDISEIPAFNQGSLSSVLHSGCVDYNARFANTINQAMSLCPGLTIYTPDFFTLLNNVLANSGYYGLTNPLSGGFSIDALDSLYSSSKTVLNGQGNNYIFWDPQDPTAQFHEIIADVTQQIISPVSIGKLTLGKGINQLDLVNLPVGLNGFVESSPNWALAGWAPIATLSSTAINQSLLVNAPPLPPSTPAGGTGGDGSTDPNDPNNQNTTYIAPTNSAQFYRLHFPYSWSWP